MQDLNIISLFGRLTKDAEVRTLPTGTEIVSFSVACNEARKTKDGWKNEASFFEVVSFSAKIAPLLTRGVAVVLSGRLRQERWQDREGNNRSKIVIVADTVRVCGAGSQKVVDDDSNGVPF